MGLDMHLYAEKYTSGYSNKEENSELRKFIPFLQDDDTASIYLKAEIGYWRKSNQVHNWFVQNVQNGNDDCGTYYVSTQNLEDLKLLCKKVLDGSKLVDGTVVNGYTSKGGEPLQPNMQEGKIVEDPTLAIENLPPSDGFFFGSNYIDEFYIRDLESTVEIIDKCLKLNDEWDFYYSSSW